MIYHSLGKIDRFAMTRKHPSLQHNTDTYVVADVRPTLLIHDSSITNSDAEPQFGSAHGQLLVVADGVGDRASAARASALVVDRVNAHLLDTFGLPGVDPRTNRHLFDCFREALEDCQTVMQNEVEVADRFDEMGAVLTAIYIVWPVAYVMHVGNNRAYHCRRSSIAQLTVDHTMANRLVDMGQLSLRRADESRLRHVVWNLVGTQTEKAEPECKELELAMGDAIILCSDGMAAAVNHVEIADAVRSTDTAQETCKALFRVAEQHGLDDDATVLVTRFADRESAARLLAREMERPVSRSHSIKPDVVPSDQLDHK